MSAREPSEAKKSAAAARRTPAEAVAEAPEARQGITFEEMQAGYEQQIGSLVSQVIQQNIVIKKLQDELTEKKESPA